ncbi:MAG: hypothetical protein Q9225_000425 [Loekoesia sp. 1 TL-2023]
MAGPSLPLPATEMDEKFLEDVTSPYELHIADSKMPGAGFGLFVREEVPAGKEVFRVAVPAVSAVYREMSAHGFKASEMGLAIRTLIRLMVLHQSGRLADNQWQAILALKSHRALITQSKELDWAATKADIRLVKEAIKDDVSENDLEDMYFRGFEEQGEVLTGDPIIDAPIRLARSQLHAILDALADDNQELSSVEAKIREIFDNLSSRKPWPIHVSPVPNIYVMLAERSEREQQWEKALHYWLKIVYVIDPLRYPDRLNIHRVDDLMSLTQLEARISQMSKTDSAIKANFSTMEASISAVQYGHNSRLKADAAASLGANHVIYKVAAHYVEVKDKQMMTSIGVSPSVRQSGPLRETRDERFRLGERKLLEWAGIDITDKTL